MKTTLAYLQLMRLPNVFTAMADIFMGFLFVHRGMQPVGELIALLIASGCLYTAGMVLNDLFDVEVDARERAFRPLPSRRVSRKAARRLALGLLAVGVVAAFGAAWQSGLVALAIVAAVLLYNALLKATPFGPVAMGLCRFLNVLLGMSGAGWSAASITLRGGLAIAGAMGLYIAGVTWFARREAETSSRLQLALAAVTINLALVALATVGDWLRFSLIPYMWLLLAVTAWTIGRRLVLAIAKPEPARVQAAVKSCLMSYILIHAATVCGFLGPWWALSVIALLIPAVLLGRWVYAT